MTSRPITVRRLAATALFATLAVASVGCSTVGGDSDDSMSGSDVAADAPAEAPRAASVDVLESNSSGKAAHSVQQTAVISTGTAQLRDDDVQAARDKVVAVATGHGGKVDDEKSTSDDDGVLRTTHLVLRVPSEDFEQALAEITKVGDLKSSTNHSEDVTTQVIDNQIRVQAQARSIRRIEQLLDQAQSIRDIMAIEAQLTRRQADLDSLRAQQAWLRDQTSLATLTVDIDRTDVPVAEEDNHGFLAGLSAGWNGLKATTVGVLTATGALLPFLLVLALIGWPVWLLVRRTGRRGAGADLSEPASADDRP